MSPSFDIFVSVVKLSLPGPGKNKFLFGNSLNETERTKEKTKRERVSTNRQILTCDT